MLAALMVGHFYLILDAMQDAFQSEPGKKATSNGLVGLDRGLFGVLKELRLAQKRPAAPMQAEVANGTFVATPSPDPTSDSEAVTAENAAATANTTPEHAATSGAGRSWPVPPHAAFAANSVSRFPSGAEADDAAFLERLMAGDALLAAVQQGLREAPPEDIPLAAVAGAD